MKKYHKSFLFVPIGSKDEYMNHNLWKKFFRIEEFDTEGIGEVPVGHVAQGKQQRYNIMGQPVGKDYHGVVIENGRKILVK